MLWTVLSIIIKPEPTRRVDPGSDRSGGWTDLSKVKDRTKQKPSETRLIRQVDLTKLDRDFLKFII
jgi:hypothetical protein